MAQVDEINGIVSGDLGLGAGAGDGLDQVNTAVNQMDQVTQQNAAMVEQTTAASYEMASETVKLSELISRFVTGDVAQGPRYEGGSQSDTAEPVESAHACTRIGLEDRRPRRCRPEADRSAAGRNRELAGILEHAAKKSARALG